MEDLGFTPTLTESPRRPGRPANAVKTEALTLSLMPQQREMLEDLTLTGYFGRNLVETATMLLLQAMETQALERLAKMREFTKERDERRLRQQADKMARIQAIMDEPEK